MLSDKNTNSLIGSISTVTCGFVLGWLLKSWFYREKKSVKNNDKFAVGNTSEESFSDFVTGEHKLVLVVQNGLKMGKGKIAAQCSHASVMAYKQASKSNKESLKQWLKCGQMKVVVKVDDEESMLEIADKARKSGLTVSLVRDAGRTQIPSGSKTVLGVGPGPAALIDSVTGHLKLL